MYVAIFHQKWLVRWMSVLLMFHKFPSPEDTKNFQIVDVTDCWSTRLSITNTNVPVRVRWTNRLSKWAGSRWGQNSEIVWIPHNNAGHRPLVTFSEMNWIIEKLGQSSFCKDRQKQFLAVFSSSYDTKFSRIIELQLQQILLVFLQVFCFYRTINIIL